MRCTPCGWVAVGGCRGLECSNLWSFFEGMFLRACLWKLEFWDNSMRCWTRHDVLLSADWCWWTVLRLQIANICQTKCIFCSCSKQPSTVPTS
jgi:hypothetical protein